MTGQCEFHPFDQAVDVCSVCYADICDSCLTSVRSRPEIVCRDCTITLSGVRGSSKTEIRGDKATVEARRSALQPDSSQETPLETDDTEWIREDSVNGIRGKLSSMAAGFLPGSGSRPAIADAATGGQLGRSKKKSPEASYAEDSAVHKLDRLRQSQPSDGLSNDGLSNDEPGSGGPNESATDHDAGDTGSDSWTDDRQVESGPGGEWPSLPDGGGTAPTPIPPETAAPLPHPDRRSPQPSPEALEEPGQSESEEDWSEVAAPDLSQDPFAAR